MITVLGIIAITFALLQLAVSLINVIFRERMKGSVPGRALVSVLIPARNEEAHIATIVEDVLSQEHHEFELIVCDDQSGDRTAAIVESYAARDRRVKLIRAGDLPEGWLGKNHACHALAMQASGEYFLFLDADVRIGGDIIGQAIAYAEKRSLSLISIFPKQIMKSFGERISVPVMNHILLTLLPLILVRTSPRPSLAAANGQFMFFRAQDYRKLLPHESMKGHRVEDIAIARHYKAGGLKISCQTGDERISCRMYRGFREAMHGFSKNIFEYFGGSPVPAWLFWAVTTAGVVFVITGLLLPWLIIYLGAVLLTRIFVSLSSRQNIALNIILFVFQQLAMGLFMAVASLNAAGRGYRWKGRKV